MSVTIADGVVLTVEIGFSTSGGDGLLPYGGLFSSIVWTDVSAYVVGDIVTNRGRSKELDAFQAGTATVTFKNDDRRFDPDYAAGPYYGKLTPMRPLRITATYGSPSSLNYDSSTSYDNAGSYDTVYSIFTGYIDGWPQHYDPPRWSTVTVNATDGFKPLTQGTMKSYWIGTLVDQLTNLSVMRLNEPTGSTSASMTGLGPYAISRTGLGTWRNATNTATVTSTQVDGLIVNDSSKASQFDGTAYLSNQPTDVTLGTVYGIYLVTRPYGTGFPGFPGGWFSTTTTTDGRYGLVFNGIPGYPAVGVVVSGGVAYVEASIPASANATTADRWQSDIIVNDGKPHHFAIVDTGDGFTTPALRLVVDGVVATTSLVSSTIYTYVTEGVIGGPVLCSATLYDFTKLFVGTIQDVYETNAMLGADKALTQYRVGLGVYGSGELTSARVARVLDLAKWPSDARSIDIGASTVQAPDTEGKNVLEYLKAIETSEQGRLYMDAAGRVAFRSRKALLSAGPYVASQATFGDAPGSGELGYTDLRPVYDDQLIKNKVTVSRENGTDVYVEDQSSVNQYLERSDSLTGLLNDSQQTVVDFANARLSSYKQPRPRVEAITVNPRGNPSALYPKVLGFGIGTRITVNRRPQGVGSVISRDVIIEGVSHSIGPRHWETTWSLSPAAISDYLVLDNPILGKLDSNRLGY